ncbi:single-stranded DNA-binding protein [Corchorus olitorius]|uniref:Single-stranded DNA-binding protein n=1 Tax=Corchorus olitorius TaxID=93759 RepID=A0A1R3KTU7_9ROSI|nr:single-stranded DNA-binding protein [Corchorus olitorius]
MSGSTTISSIEYKRANDGIAMNIARYSFHFDEHSTVHVTATLLSRGDEMQIKNSGYRREWKGKAFWAAFDPGSSPARDLCLLRSERVPRLEHADNHKAAIRYIHPLCRDSPSHMLMSGGRLPEAT